MPAQPARLRGRTIDPGRCRAHRAFHRDVAGDGRRTLRRVIGGGFDHHVGGCRADPGDQGELASAHHHRRLHVGRRHSGPAQLRRRGRLCRCRLRSSRIHLLAVYLDSDLGARGCGPRGSRLSHRPAPASRGDHRRARRPQTGSPDAHGLPGMQGEGHRVLARGPRDSVPGSGDARRVRSPVPVHRPGLLRLLRTVRGCQHRRPRSAPARQRHGPCRRLAPVRHVLRGQPGVRPAVTGSVGGHGNRGRRRGRGRTR